MRPGDTVSILSEMPGYSKVAGFGIFMPGLSLKEGRFDTQRQANQNMRKLIGSLTHNDLKEHWNIAFYS